MAGERMIRVCAVCRRIFGCRGDGVAATCDQCEERCDFHGMTEDEVKGPIHHGVCGSCIQQKFLLRRPECS
jgi:hypothetical protein